jgi:peptidoglycan/LPS O-acetylase OafA/YrhL
VNNIPSANHECATRMKPPKTEWLYGLRGFAALIVVFGHCSNVGLDIIPYVGLSTTAKSGVWLFFVLSAYLLVRPLAGEMAANGPRAAVGFYIRRAFRILPLYYVVLFTLSWRGILSPVQTWLHAVFLEGDAHLWTMPVEMAFYAVLPAFALIANRNAAFSLLAVSIALYAINPGAIAANSILLTNYAIFFALGIVVSYLQPSSRGLVWGLSVSC